MKIFTPENNYHGLERGIDAPDDTMTEEQEKAEKIEYRNSVADYVDKLVNGDTLPGYDHKPDYTFLESIEEIAVDVDFVNALRHLMAAETEEQSAKAAYILKNLLHIYVTGMAGDLYESHRLDGFEL